MKYNHRLLDEINKRGYTITGFCSEKNIAPCTIYHLIEGRKKSLHGSTIYMIAEALNMPYEIVKEMCVPA